VQQGARFNDTHAKWHHLLQWRIVPPETCDHRTPHIVQSAQFHFGANEGEEHAELGAPHALEQSAEDVIIVEEVTPTFQLARIERTLQLQEEVVELAQHNRTRTGWEDAGAALDNLQPLLDVYLQP
jgi:hypothetical protein